MGFYDLSKEQRLLLVNKISGEIFTDIQRDNSVSLVNYCADEDTYIRKAAYLAIGKIYKEHPNLQSKIIKLLERLMRSSNEKLRQTTINGAGEIGIKDFCSVEHFFDEGLFDEHHIVRNAVIGSIKKMGEKNPEPVLSWAKKYLHHADKEVRREICHGIELRGRTHPQDILPLLKELQFDKTARVRNTLVHVLGQIAYKKDCLRTVIEQLKSWDNIELVFAALEEIIDVHHRYKDFASLSQQEAIDYIDEHFSRKEKKMRG